MVRTPRSHCQGCRFDHRWSGNKDPTGRKAWPNLKKKKKKAQPVRTGLILQAPQQGLNTTLHGALGKKRYLLSWSLHFRREIISTHLKQFMRKKKFLSLGHGSFAQGFSSLLYEVFMLCFHFEDNLKELTCMFWISSSPKQFQ